MLIRDMRRDMRDAWNKAPRTLVIEYQREHFEDDLPVLVGLRYCIYDPHKDCVIAAVAPLHLFIGLWYWWKEKRWFIERTLLRWLSRRLYS